MRNTLIYFSVFLFTVLLFAEPAFADSNGQLTINEANIVDSMTNTTANESTNALFNDSINGKTNKQKDFVPLNENSLTFNKQTSKNTLVNVDELFANYSDQTIGTNKAEENVASQTNGIFISMFSFVFLIGMFGAIYLGNYYAKKRHLNI